MSVTQAVHSIKNSHCEETMNKLNLISNLRIIYFFLILFLFSYLLVFQSGTSILWFCKIALFILLIGLLFNKNILLSYVLIAQSLVALVFVLELIGLLIFKISLFQLSELYSSSLDWLISIFYHVVSVFVPLHILLLKKKFVKKAWIWTSLTFFFLSSLIYILIIFGVNIDSTINCVSYCYKFGILTIFTYFIYSKINLPTFLINSLGLSIFYFLSAMFFNWIIKRRVVSNKKINKIK
jgi:hypothetical protein